MTNYRLIRPKPQNALLQFVADLLYMLYNKFNRKFTTSCRAQSPYHIEGLQQIRHIWYAEMLHSLFYDLLF